MASIESGIGRRQAVQTLGLAAGGGALALACGSDEKSEPRAAGTQAVGGATQAAVTKTPKRGGTLIVDSGEPQPTAIVYNFSAANVYLRWGIWDSLVIHGPDNRPKPMLAETYEMKPDFTGVHIKLRSGVEFHSGRKLTSEDVRFSIEAFRADNVNSQLKNAMKQITEIKVVDERTLDLTFVGRRPYFDDVFALLPIVDKDTLEQHRQMKVLVGSGPFKFVSYTPQQGYVMERNPNYWDQGKPYLDRIQGRIYSDAEARALALQTGELRHSVLVSYKMAKQFKSNKDLIVTDSGVQGTSYMGMVVGYAGLRDPRVRRALSLAIDRKRIAKEWGEGVIEAQALPWPRDGVAFIAEDEALIKYDPEQAKSLLKQAGAGGLSLPVDVSQDREDLAQFAQSDWKAIGVNAQLNLSEQSAWADRIRQSKMEAIWGYASAGAGNAMHPATFFTLSEVIGVPNTSGYDPPAYKALQAQLLEMDPRSPAGRELIHQWNKLYLFDEPWLVPLAASITFHAMRKNVIAPPPVGGPGKRPPIAEMWLDS